SRHRSTHVSDYLLLCMGLFCIFQLGCSLVAQDRNRRRTGAGNFRIGYRVQALRIAKCAPQNAIAAPRPSAARPASTPEMVGIGLGAEAAWPAPARISTPTAIRNWRIRCGICPDTALCIRLAVR